MSGRRKNPNVVAMVLASGKGSRLAPHARERDYDGIVHFIPNNLITTVSNMSREFAQSVVDVGVAYREDVQPLQQRNVRRQYLRRLKKAFDAHGLEIPFPGLTIYSGQLEDGSTSPFHLMLADTARSAGDEASPRLS